MVSIWALLTYTPILAQEALTLQVPDTVVNAADTLRLDITARNFSDIVSAQFSVNWDASVIQYAYFEETNLPFIAIGNADAANGNLRFSWFDIQGAGQTIADGSSIVRLVFFVNGDPGDLTEVNLTDMPLDIQVFRATETNGQFEEVELDQQNGSVLVAGGAGVNFQVTNVRCNGGDDGAINTLVTLPDAAAVNWSGPNGFQSNAEDITDLIAGDYTLEILDGNGAVLLDSTVTISQPATALQIDNIDVTNASCASPNGAATINASGGIAPYRFDIGDGFENTNRFAMLAPATYTATVRDTNNCEVTDSFTIELNDAPDLNLTDTVFLCDGENALLDAGQFNTYTWSNGATTRSISVSEPGAYSVTVSDAPGCEAADTIQVVPGGEVNADIQVATTAICPGDSVELTASGGDMFQWQDDSGTLSATNIASPVARPTEETTYFVEVSNGCGTGKDSILIQVYEINSGVSPDTCIGPGDELELEAFGGVEYFWFANQYPVSDSSIPNPTVSPEDSTSYFVMITDVNGCENLDTVQVLVANNPLDILAINLITPNGDGKNDVLEFGNISKYGVNSLKVYNRWGDLIYNKVNYQDDEERFDGTYKGKELPAGNYFYVLAFRDGEIKQTLTILRE